MNVNEQIDTSRLPRHIAVIMDGNGRWAQRQNKPRVYGHQHGVESVRQITEACAELGVPYLTLFAFSTENWNRPQEEVDALMALLVETIRSEIDTLHKNNIRLRAIGNLDRLPPKTHEALLQAIDDTSTNDRLNLVLALNYSGKWDLLQAAQKAARDNAVDLTEDKMNSYLSTSGMPDPELMIRTSGELRISNFFLWQLAYAELYFSEIAWPEFRKEHLHEAIVTFQQRERRYGKTSAQVQNINK